MQTIVLYLCYIILILLFSTAYNTSLIYCFVIWCLHTNKRRPCSSTLSGHPSSSCPRRGFALGLAPERQSESKDMLFLHSEKLHREDFTHRSLYTERDLHRAAFTQTLLHTDAFTYRSFYTDKPFLKKPYHMKPLTQSSFTHRRFFT